MAPSMNEGQYSFGEQAGGNTGGFGAPQTGVTISTKRPLEFAGCGGRVLRLWLYIFIFSCSSFVIFVTKYISLV